MPGKNNHTDVWEIFGDSEGSFEAVKPWHGNIHEHQVGRMRLEQSEGFMTVIGFAHHFHRGDGFELGPDASTDNGVVVHENDTNRQHRNRSYSAKELDRHLSGNQASTRVPSPRQESSSRLPPARAARSSIPSKPRLAPRWAASR